MSSQASPHPSETSSETQAKTQASAQAEAQGLLPHEFSHLHTSLARLPNPTEIGIFAAMWSEHCSYKSTRHLLNTLPSTGPAVIAGPGENAGVVDIGGGMAAVFKIESHNHPSFISPYQGAATGVGGILRDIFTMGARPVALLNSLHFGDPTHPLTRHYLTQVVAGIGGYGNAIGIPTVGGESHFSHRYNSNILVNAMAVGIAKQKSIFRSAATGAGNLVVYIGAKTGRDGIHGASMASAELSAADHTHTSKRPSVQIGDPLAGKLVMEACLELMAGRLVLAAQDMGAAGLTSSSVEMASKGGVGIRLELDNLPLREADMTARDIMLSESQERMLVIVAPKALDKVAACLAKWGVDWAVIGEVTDSGQLEVVHLGDEVVNLPIDLIAHGCPPSPAVPSDTPSPSNIAKKPLAKPPASTPSPSDMPVTEALRRMLASADLASRAWIYQQYDRHVMADTLLASGAADAAVIRVHGTRRAIAMTTDCTHRYCEADAYHGTALAVCEAYRNISAVGATPLAVTNNLNFGSPYAPDIMTQLTEAVAGLGDACRGFGLPVVSGNVSLHNETDGVAIAPTPVIGMLGVLDEVALATGYGLNKSQLALYIIGQEAAGGLAGSVWARVIASDDALVAPPYDVASEKLHSQFVRGLVHAKLVAGVHDISDGGVLVAVAEMLLAGGDAGGNYIGANLADTAWTHELAFGEGQGRFLIASDQPSAIEKLAKTEKIPLWHIGVTSDDKRLTCGEGESILVEELARGWRDCLPRLAQT